MPRKAEPRVTTEQQVFPTRLRELMEKRNVNQKQLAAIIGMRPQTVSLYTGGQSTPDINCLRKIAEYFHVSCDWLVGLADPDNSTADEKLSMVSEYTGLSNTAVSRVLLETAPPIGLPILEDKMDLISVLNTLLISSSFWKIARLLRGYINTPKQERSRAAEIYREYRVINYGIEENDPTIVRDVLGYRMLRAFNALLDEIDNNGSEGDKNGKH